MKKTLFIDGKPLLSQGKPITMDVDHLPGKGMYLIHLIEQAWPNCLPEYREAERKGK